MIIVFRPYLDIYTLSSPLQFISCDLPTPSVCMHVCGGQRTAFQSQFSPPCMESMMELRWPDLYRKFFYILIYLDRPCLIFLIVRKLTRITGEVHLFIGDMKCQLCTNLKPVLTWI